MKKNKVVLVIAMFGVVTFVTTLNTMRNNQMSDLILNNVEALASSEDNPGGGEKPAKWICYRTGTVDCPDGSKAEVVIEAWSL